MKILLDCEGRSIRLTEERLAHIREHPEMVPFVGTLRAALADPHRVIESLSDRQVRLYYRQCVHIRVGEKFLCAVVKVRAADAFVITAYLTDTMKKGHVIWPIKS